MGFYFLIETNHLKYWEGDKEEDKMLIFALPVTLS
jgi:hypothetical protein